MRNILEVRKRMREANQLIEGFNTITEQSDQERLVLSNLETNVQELDSNLNHLEKLYNSFSETNDADVDELKNATIKTSESYYTMLETYDNLNTIFQIKIENDSINLETPGPSYR